MKEIYKDGYRLAKKVHIRNECKLLKIRGSWAHSWRPHEHHSLVWVLTFDNQADLNYYKICAKHVNMTGIEFRVKDGL